MADGARQSRVIALTGATSFLGRNLTGLLEEDVSVDKIVSLGPRQPDTAADKTVHHELDLTSAEAAEQTAVLFERENIDTLVHLAFLNSPGPAKVWSHELESVGTMHIVNACRRAGVNKLVMRSSTLLYGADNTNPNFLTEAHPLRARRSEAFFLDKIEAENEVLRFASSSPDRTVTVLRMAPLLGPNVSNFVTKYFSRRLIMTIMGYDPLCQFVHEADAVAAFKLALDRDVSGVYNIVGDGVIPLSHLVRLNQRRGIPLPRFLAGPVATATWFAQLGEAPSGFLDYLQYLCVADGSLAEKHLGYRPVYTSREAFIDFVAGRHGAKELAG